MSRKSESGAPSIPGRQQRYRDIYRDLDAAEADLDVLPDDVREQERQRLSTSRNLLSDWRIRNSMARGVLERIPGRVERNDRTLADAETAVRSARTLSEEARLQQGLSQTSGPSGSYISSPPPAPPAPAVEASQQDARLMVSRPITSWRSMEDRIQWERNQSTRRVSRPPPPTSARPHSRPPLDYSYDPPRAPSYESAAPAGLMPPARRQAATSQPNLSGGYSAPSGNTPTPPPAFTPGHRAQVSAVGRPSSIASTLASAHGTSSGETSLDYASDTESSRHSQASQSQVSHRSSAGHRSHSSASASASTSSSRPHHRRHRSMPARGVWTSGASK